MAISIPSGSGAVERTQRKPSIWRGMIRAIGALGAGVEAIHVGSPTAILEKEMDTIRQAVITRALAAISDELDAAGGEVTVLLQISESGIDTVDKLKRMLLIRTCNAHIPIAIEANRRSADLYVNREEIVQTVRALIHEAIKAYGGTSLEHDEVPNPKAQLV
ncbi:hypothetical protein KJ652_01800 [Patescibacteria group bacterium]|nr:hypothetical protein [Patescibacteria group bacterium]